MPVDTLELPRQMIDAVETYAAREHVTVCDLFAQLLHSRYGFELKLSVSPTVRPVRRKRQVRVPDSVRAISGVVTLPDDASEAEIVREAVMAN